MDTINFRSNDIRKLDLRNEPRLEIIENGFLLSNHNGNKRHESDVDKAIEIFEQYQDDWLAYQKQQTDQRIKNLEKQIEDEKEKKQKIDQAFQNTKKEINKKLVTLRKNHSE